MAKLTAAERAKLPDAAFAYIDSAGKRRLPINDESHVRNALSRFGQVRFESEAARQQARTRVLRAAKRHGIVPIGFMDAELATSRRSSPGRLLIELGRIDDSATLEAELRDTLGDPALQLVRWSRAGGTYVDAAGDPVVPPADGSGRTATYLQGRGRPLMALFHATGALRSDEMTEAVLGAVHLVTGRELLDEVDELGVATDGLPDGVVTFLLTDIEGSTPLLSALGDRYADVLTEVRAAIRDAVVRMGGRQVEARADEFVAVFEAPDAAVEAACAFHRALAERAWPEDRPVRVRAGIHTGEITLTESGYVGLTVHAAARIMAAAHGGQTLVSGASVQASRERSCFRSLGAFELRGLAGGYELHQVEPEGTRLEFPPPSV